MMVDDRSLQVLGVAFGFSVGEVEENARDTVLIKSAAGFISLYACNFHILSPPQRTSLWQ